MPYFNDVSTAPLAVRNLILARARLSPEDQGKVELIIVDDCSQKSFPEKLPDTWTQVIRLEKNSGVGFVRNFGISKTKFSHVLFIDSDILVSDGALLRIFQRLTLPSPPRFLQGLFAPTPANPNPTLFQRYMALTWRFNQVMLARVGGSPGIATSFLVTEKAFFEKIGGFVSKYKGAGGEEFEILNRIATTDVETDSKIEFFHYFDSFFERLRIVFKRGMNMNSNVGGHDHFPLSFKIQCAKRVIFGWLIAAAIFAIPLIPDMAIKSIFGLYLLTLLTELRQIIFVLKLNSPFMAAVTLFYLPIEYGAVGLGMVIDKIGLNSNIQNLPGASVEGKS